jgi:phage tail sheath protein FI
MGPCGLTENDTKSKLNNIASIAAERKDCMAFGSAHKTNIIAGDGNVSSNAVITKNLKSFFSDVSSNSYLVLDGNYKYVYDRWNDVYKYIPCNTDIAGLVADTAIRNEPWFSPAGFSRGGIRNLAKLAWNPSKSDRDELYSNRINPIVSFPGQGAVLFGDKTALSTPSAFDRINVRKLFLTVERAIEEAAKAQLFEINDEVTRGVFRAIVEPFLRDVQSRRGITDFLVVCDETNNTPTVIDANEFLAEIYIQPARSINYITLTFTATRTGIDFSEVIAR